jgi:[protein-PII] uridylyltransferase
VEFQAGDHVVYPTHGVGTVQGIESMSAAGHTLQVIVVTFDENRMTLRVPVGKASSSGLRKLASDYGDEAAAHFAHMPERYFRTFSASEIAGHVRLFRKFFATQSKECTSGVCPAVKWMHHPEQGHSEVLLCGWDHPGLIVRMCGAFLAARVNILSADIHTRTDNLVLDIFRVCDTRHEPVDSERDHRLFERLLDESLQDPDFDFAPHIAKARTRSGYHMSQEADIPTRITVDNRSHPSFRGLITQSKMKRLLWRTPQPVSIYP